MMTGHKWLDQLWTSTPEMISRRMVGRDPGSHDFQVAQAVLQAKVAHDNARAARNLVRATWALVLATFLLVLVTAAYVL